jgi:hypothetical protein
MIRHSDQLRRTLSDLENRSGKPVLTGEAKAAHEKLIALYKGALEKIENGEIRDYEVPDHDPHQYIERRRHLT